MCLHLRVYFARWLLIAFTLIGSAAHALAPNQKVTLHLELDTPKAARGANTGLQILSEIEPGWHINAHTPTETYLIPTEVLLTLPSGVSADIINYPLPERKTFAFAQGKQLLVYEGKLDITTALHVPADFSGTRIRIEARMRYQACSDSTCLPPVTATAELLAPVSATISAAAQPVAAPATAREQHAGAFDVNAWMSTHGVAVTLLLVALLGLGLNLTPCVYPLISVTIAYFGSQGRHRGARVTALAAVYVLGITVSFAVLGVLAALSGGLFGAALQKPPVLFLIAAILVALALSSFGVYQLRPPAWVMQRVGGSVQGAFGSFLMGLTMGVVAAPCVGPVVLGLLLFVGSRQSGVLGFEMFFALGLGMGLPYLALAVAAGSIKALPRSGEWMVWVERFFGVVLLALAAYFLTPLLPKAVSHLLLPGLIAAGGIYLGFIDRSGLRMRYFPSIKRVVGIAAVVIAAWAVVPQRAESSIGWQPLDPNSLDIARRSGKPAVVDFVADWCIPCKEMENTTFRDPRVRQQAERFAMFIADITSESDEMDDLVERYEVRGVPTLIVFDRSGTEVQRFVGYTGPDEMAKAMREIR
jgi:thiol:disulfide interchange protein DsbD